MKMNTGSFKVALAVVLLAGAAAVGAAEPEEAVFMERAKVDDPDAFASLRFHNGSAELTPRTLGILDSLIDQMVAGDKTIEIVGHTSGLGSEAANQKLSEARVEAVRAWLVGHGIPPERLKVAAVGESQPLDSNDTAEGRQRNRRVDLKYAQ